MNFWLDGFVSSEVAGSGWVEMRWYEMRWDEPPQMEKKELWDQFAPPYANTAEWFTKGNFDEYSQRTILSIV